MISLFWGLHSADRCHFVTSTTRRGRSNAVKKMPSHMLLKLSCYAFKLWCYNFRMPNVIPGSHKGNSYRIYTKGN